jgi:hypothetical protein
MTRYYVNDNEQANGDHEVHVPTCSWFDQIKSKTYLGDYASCGPAVTEAKKTYPQSNGCAYCCPACNTG